MSDPDRRTEPFTVSQPATRLEIAIPDTAHDALVAAQQAVDAATAQLNTLLAGMLAMQNIKAGTVVQVTGPPWMLVVEVSPNGGGS